MSSTQLFTNRAGNTLIKKLEGVFTRVPNIACFDVLVEPGFGLSVAACTPPWCGGEKVLKSKFIFWASEQAALRRLVLRLPPLLVRP